MNAGVGGFLVGVGVMFYLAVFLKDNPANDLCYQSCVAVCGKSEVHASSPALCVCKDGSTHRGKFPEFYR